MIPTTLVPHVYALFRMVFGVLFLMHGLQKLAGMFGGVPGVDGGVPIASLFGLAGVIETVTGTLILIGLFTRPAAFVASGMMAFAYFSVHQAMGPWPIVNMGEPAVMNCFAFLYMAARGSGVWSADQLRSGTAHAVGSRVTSASSVNS